MEISQLQGLQYAVAEAKLEQALPARPGRRLLHQLSNLPDGRYDYCSIAVSEPMPDRVVVGEPIADVVAYLQAGLVSPVSFDLVPWVLLTAASCP